MSKDKGILVFCWILCVVLLKRFIPLNKLRQGVLAFLYKQVVTWFFGLVVVEKGLIKYPVRYFKKSYKGSFSFEYFLYPSICAIFNIYYPQKRSNLHKFLYINFFTSILTIIEVLIEKYTNLIKYVKWKWYWSYITMAVSNYISTLFYRWFFKEGNNSTK
jgi:hypothetical protein